MIYQLFEQLGPRGTTVAVLEPGVPVDV